MKAGVSVWCFPGDWSLQRIFEFSKEVGFDGVELALAEEGEVNLNSTYDEIQSIKKMAAEYGIELYSVASGLYWNYSLTSNDEAVRNKAKSIVKKQLDIASWLDCDTILVVPGSVGPDSTPDGGMVEYDVAYERALDTMNELKEYAEKTGVVIGVENVWNKFLLSPLEFRDFIDKAQSKYVAAYFDVGNVIYSGYAEQWIKILGNRIKKVHFKDYRSSVGTLSGFVDLLSGDVNYPAVMAEFKKIGYDGWVTAEIFSDGPYPEQNVINIVNSMRRIINS